MRTALMAPTRVEERESWRHAVVLVADVGLVAVAVFGIIALALDRWSPQTLDYLTHEDGWVENFQAVFYGVASAAFVLAVRRGDRLRNFWRALLALLFFVTLGE